MIEWIKKEDKNEIITISFLSYFFIFLSHRLYCVNFKIWYWKFYHVYWSSSTKDPADPHCPHWFVVLVLPSQVFVIKIATARKVTCEEDDTPLAPHRLRLCEENEGLLVVYDNQCRVRWPCACARGKEVHSLWRDLKIRGRRWQRKRRWKSEFALFQASSRLLQVTDFVKCWWTLLKLNS